MFANGSDLGNKSEFTAVNKYTASVISIGVNTKLEHSNFLANFKAFSLCANARLRGWQRIPQNLNTTTVTTATHWDWKRHALTVPLEAFVSILAEDSRTSLKRWFANWYHFSTIAHRQHLFDLALIGSDSTSIYH